MTTQVTTAQAGVQKAVSTTTNVDASTGNGACLHGPGGGDPVNCNLYSAKEDVWLSGLPVDLLDGEYFIAVLAPGGQNDPNDGSADLLSTDTRADRTFSIAGGEIVSTSGHLLENDKLQLAPYLDTPNPGGVYILAVCSTDDDPVDPSSCKYDAFKVRSGPPTDPGDEFADPLTVTKDAAGAYTKTWTWTIDKSVDKTEVRKVSGNAIFNYTAAVQHDAGTVSDVSVSGTITVHNPNDEAVSDVDVTDTLSDGTVCDVTGGDNALIGAGADETFAYTCALTGLPQGQLDNTAAIAWDEQVLADDKILEAGDDDFTFTSIVFTETAVDDCVDVDDAFDGGTAVLLGTVCVGDANPTEFTYSQTIPVLAGCVEYDNTATYTTNTTGATDGDSETVTVCGPLDTGARTIGFWQNKNGQGLIKAGHATAGVCDSGTYLRKYKPFQDLSATANCRTVADYVANVIKKANASGASMNAMLKAQMLATALDVFFTQDGSDSFLPDTHLGDVVIDLDHVCKDVGSCSTFQDVGAAFGGASSLTVTQLLCYAASQSNVGGSTWYGQNKVTQGLAKDTFDAINNEVAFGP